MAFGTRTAGAMRAAEGSAMSDRSILRVTTQRGL